ncbi:MAG: dihydrofolate reductase family protein, partial [Candidatus Thalassarchaeaceae archaeon]|nr:dihydrofolate reductase family protein [Candidatus Thalassarchaeaceae archaeon]
SGEEGVDLVQLLDLLGDREVQRLLVEGGPDVWARFLADGLVDEACIFHSKVDLGEGLNGRITSEILEGAGLMLVSSENIGSDRMEHWVRA